MFFWAITATLLYISAAQDRVPTERLFLDPASVAGQPWYTGLLHELGVLGWTVAATAAAGGGLVATMAARWRAAWFLSSGAVLTAVLLVDDVTAFHAQAGPALGVPKLVTIGALLGAAALWFGANRREIGRTRWLMLLASLGALSLSVLVDIERRESDLHVFFEDAPKLMGIVGWATYFVYTSVDLTRSVVAGPADGAPA